MTYESEFEETFHFVADENLRKHLGDALQYSAELSIIAKKILSRKD